MHRSIYPFSDAHYDNWVGFAGGLPHANPHTNPHRGKPLIDGALKESEQPLLEVGSDTFFDRTLKVFDERRVPNGNSSN